MRKVICAIGLFLLSLVTTSTAFAGDGTIHRMGEKVPNSYIVKLSAGQDAEKIATELAVRHGGAVNAVMDRLGQFSIHLPNEFAAEAIARDPRVAYVQEDGIVHLLSCRTLPSDGSLWALGHLNNLSNSTHFGAFLGPSLSSVRVFVLDTAMNTAVTDFQGKIVHVHDSSDPTCYLGAAPPPGNPPKLYGGYLSNHGGDVASLIFGNVHGVVPELTSIDSVVVFNTYGCANDTSLTSGANFVIANHPPGTPAVVNLSVGNSTQDQAIYDAFKAVVDNGVLVVASAGNDAKDACLTSPPGLGGPARYPGLMAVGATNIYGSQTSYSNYGACVDLWAPGGDGYKGVMTADGYMTGTSFSAPEATGASVVVLSNYPYMSPGNVEQQITRSSVSRSGLLMLQIPDGCASDTLVNICTTTVCPVTQ